jgi:hypothetical protein
LIKKKEIHFAIGPRTYLDRIQSDYQDYFLSSTMMMTIMAWKCLIETNFPGHPQENTAAHLQRQPQQYSQMNRFLSRAKWVAARE